MSYQEFMNLINGFMNESPLGKIVSIRAESDRDRLKSFTPIEHQVRNEWRKKCENRFVSSITQKERNESMDALKNVFKQLSS